MTTIATTGTKMDKKLKAKWVKALRSGKYKQGTFLFQNDDRFCCLGVLCVVARRKPMTKSGSNWEFVRKAVACPKDGRNDHVMNCAHMNDDGKPFPVIADYIEANI